MKKRKKKEKDGKWQECKRKSENVCSFCLMLNQVAPVDCFLFELLPILTCANSSLPLPTAHYTSLPLTFLSFPLSVLLFFLFFLLSKTKQNKYCHQFYLSSPINPYPQVAFNKILKYYHFIFIPSQTLNLPTILSFYFLLFFILFLFQYD